MSAPTMTPMMRQYFEIKHNYTDCILFFRLGDFYEMFFDDATLAAKLLDLTLTGRGKDENRVPMCGIPHHSAEQYISKLVKIGHKVAICDQIEDASESKGITKRDVTRVITPGTAINDTVIESESNNYLLAITHSKSGLWGVSFVDNSTGEFCCAVFETDTQLKAFTDQLDPQECLIDDSISQDLELHCLVNNVTMLTQERSKEQFLDHFSITHLTAFGLNDSVEAIPAAWSIITYLKQMHHNQLNHINLCRPLFYKDQMKIDKVSIRNLELLTPIQSDQKQGSLFWVINKTKTSMGARLLKQWLKQPLNRLSEINSRHDSLEVIKNDLLSREEIREQLQQIYDLERLLARIASDYHNPRDLLALKESLLAIFDLATILEQLDSPRLTEMADFFKEINNPKHVFNEIVALINKAIVEPAPLLISQVNFIKDGFNPELDDLKQSFQDIKNWITSLEEKEQKATGIRTLRVGFNKVFGYYFQVSKGQTDAVPEHYIRKQTLTNAERYITPELKEKETILLQGEDKQLELEQQLYKTIIQAITKHIHLLQECAKLVAELDCFQSLASIAQQYNYCRPRFNSESAHTLELIQSRHPVLEKQQPQQTIANDVFLDQDNLIMLITGPNMAGKSTLMKQVALTCVLAQMGSFVPAEKATLSLVDQLFTRIGASDNIVEGQSTFMVEMTETAHILNNATEKSLILLDEIGRGTSTYDGIAIAGSVLFYLHNTTKSRCLFATHYHELAQLPRQLGQLTNYSMAIVEENNQLAFTYKLVKGAADKSYGVHVATMAGLPKAVISQASAMLESFEATSTQPKVDGQLVLF